MAFTQTAAPAAEPLSLDDAKAYLRVDHGDDDTFISSLIVTSRLQVETALDLALIQQSWRWVGTVAPDRIVLLRPFPCFPLMLSRGSTTVWRRRYWTMVSRSMPARVRRLSASRAWSLASPNRFHRRVWGRGQRRARTDPARTAATGCALV
jgi:hypothetical protein